LNAFKWSFASCTDVIRSTLEPRPVHETFNGKTLWRGEVEEFGVFGHERATRAYAWGYTDDSGQEHMTAVLGVPPVKSAIDAVRASIVADIKKRKV
jgi:hypothetical protein